MKITRPVWVEVNLDNYRHNIMSIKDQLKEGTKLCGVIKADGYGHGAVTLAGELLDMGVERLAVATLSEAVELRKVYGDVSIMVLGYTPISDYETVIEYSITQTIYTIEQGQALSDLSLKKGVKTLVHLKIDTGMRRLGIYADEMAYATIVKLFEMKGLSIEGAFTHFAVADEVDKSFTNMQVKLYNDLMDKLEENGYIIPIKHVSNSAAIIDCPDLNYNMVRAGIMTYGLYPSGDVDHERIKLKEVMSLKARLSYVKDIESGEGVSYGLIYKAAQKMRVGTLPLGYADGYTRMLTGKAEVLINGVRKPVVGRICMDQCMVDLDGVDAKIGEVVTLFGEDGADRIAIDDVASWLGTINYEIVCMMGKRIPRVYIKDGQIVKVLDELLK